ncbi:MAG: recombinase zinc beta ribbon domain-containing protein [Pirellulaceae bacterium]|nr:recombinase zinc beta ribbon domain-containing protein [Pirellulaceae bacterium]
MSGPDGIIRGSVPASAAPSESIIEQNARRATEVVKRLSTDGELTTAQRSGKRAGEFAPIIVRDNHKALIDKSTFDAVQAKLKERSKVGGGPARKHLLSGILRCGHCGGILTGSSGNQGRSKKRPRYTYYKCKRARVSGTCENYAVRADVIEPAMIEYFRSVWQTPAGRKSLRTALASLTDETLRMRTECRESLLAQMIKLDQQITKRTENLLLLAAVDIPAASALLAQ